MNYFIVSNAERVMPEIVEKIRKPIFKVEPTKEDIAPTSKIVLGREDYWFILSYAKYLEHQSKMNEALNIYIMILEGLHDIENKSMLAMMVHVVFEKMTLQNLKNNLTRHLILEEEKIYLKEQLKTLLIKDTKILWHALEEERLDIKRILEQVSSISDSIRKQVDSIYQVHNKEFYALSSKKDLLKYEEKFLKAKRKILFTYERWGNKDIKPIRDTNMFIAVYIFFQSTPNMSFIKEELWEQIEVNKKFLESL